MEYATLEWVDCFNNRRLLEPIGNIPPDAAEANVYAALEAKSMAAKLTGISLRQTRRGSILDCKQKPEMALAHLPGQFPIT